MSTAVSNNGYAPLREVTHEEIAQFQMPQPAVGQPIRHHPKGLRNDNGAQIAFVTIVNERSIVIRTALGRLLSNVPHIDDPRLHKNAANRENGCWELTPFDVAVKEQVEAMKQLYDVQIKSLQGSVNDLKGRVKQLEQKGKGKADAPASAEPTTAETTNEA